MEKRHLIGITIYIILVVLIITSIFYAIVLNPQIIGSISRPDYLTISISMLTLITTIAISLAAYKVVSTRDVKDIISEKIDYINNSIELKFKAIQNEVARNVDDLKRDSLEYSTKIKKETRSRFEEIDNKLHLETNRLHSQVESITRKYLDTQIENTNEFINIIQDMASSKIKCSKMSFRGCKYCKNIIEYVNYMDKEIMAAYRMFLMISHPDSRVRSEGYNYISTLGGSNLDQFLNRLKVIEEDVNVRRFIDSEIEKLRKCNLN